MTVRRNQFLAAWLVLLLAARGEAAPKPVPPSPYLPLVYRYADALLQHGRDTHGPQATGLILSALDREKLAPLTTRPAAPAGVAENLRAGAPDGPLVGAVLQHDQNLLRLLYTLTELSTKPVYRDAADAELKWFLQNAAKTARDDASWEESAAWDAMADAPLRLSDSSGRGFARPWLLWDRCFELAPDESKQLATAPSKGDRKSMRQSAFAFRKLAAAYRATGEQSLLKSIEAKLNEVMSKEDPIAAFWLSAAIDLDSAARRMPHDAEAIDESDWPGIIDLVFFAEFPQDLPRRGGFSSSPTVRAGQPVNVTPRWQVGAEGRTTALVGMLCVSRYENTGHVGYRSLIHAAADAYRDSLPAAGDDAWPVTFGHAISLQLAAWRSTSRQEYLDRATKLADEAVRLFWDAGPLPRASTKSQHYESITGSDTLALALVELHLSILHITAVRSPANTLDR